MGEERRWGTEEGGEGGGEEGGWEEGRQEWGWRRGWLEEEELVKLVKLVQGIAELEPSLDSPPPLPWPWHPPLLRLRYPPLLRLRLRYPPQHRGGREETRGKRDGRMFGKENESLTEEGRASEKEGFSAPALSNSGRDEVIRDGDHECVSLTVFAPLSDDHPLSLPPDFVDCGINLVLI